MTIKKVISIPMLVLTAVASLSVLISNIVQFSGYVNENINDLLDTASAEAFNKIEMYQSYSQFISSFIAGDSVIVNGLKNGNREALIERMRDIYSRTVHDQNDAYYCTIVDSAGTVIARADAPLMYGDSLAFLPEVAMVLSDKTYTGIESTPRIRITANSGSPIHDSQGQIMGAVISGFRLDSNKFIDSIASAFKCEVSVFLADERVATTLLNEDRVRVTGTKVPPEVAEVVLAGKTFTGRVDLMGHYTIGKYVPLLKHDGQPMGIMAVGYFIEKEDGIIRSFILVGLIFVLIFLVIAIPIIEIIAKRIASPINEASRVLSAFSVGNFDVRLEGKHKGDFAILQNSINETGVKLSAYLEEKIQDDKIRELAAIVAISDAGIIVVDKDGALREWNIGAENILGYKPNEVIGQKLKHYTPVEQEGILDETQYRLEQGEHIAHIELVLRHKNSQLVYCSASFTPLYDKAGNLSGAVSVFHDISEKRAIEQTSHDLAAILTNAAAGVIVMDKDGIVRLWNRGAEEVLGYRPEEIIGHTTYFITPDDRHEYLHEVTSKLSRGEHIIHVRILRKHKDGRLIECSTSWTPIFDSLGNFNGSAAIFHDITSEVHATNKVKNLAAIVSSVDAGIIIKDAHFDVVDWNIGSEKILGYSFDEIVGKNMSYYAPEDTLGTFRAVQEALRNGRHIMHTEIVRKHKDGRRIDCSASFTPILDDNGNFTGSISVFHDISEKKNMEYALEKAVKIAEEASKTKTMFLANMSHEIRTPLNGVIGFAELALDDRGISDQVKDYLRKIKDSADGLLDIINDILDISKIESGRMELEVIPFNLQEVLNTCKSIIEPKAIEKGIVLHFYSEAFTGKRLLGDPTKLRQTLLNLLSNAVKFTNHGMVKVTAVVESEETDSAAIRFEVRDSGIGMSGDQLNNVFDPFIQADTSTTRKYGGTGLGLALTKKFVEMMGGTLEVESMPGLGSRFSFTLAFDTVPDLVASAVTQDTAPFLEKPFFSGDVLVCEDNYMNQELIINHLERIGLRPTIAMNGKQGVSCAVKRMKKGKPFDLILMDINMPVMDGLEATQKLIEAGNKTPIVALTANAISTDKERYLQHGMADYLGKPFTSQELWACLLRHLKPVEEKTSVDISAAGRRPVALAAVDDKPLIISDVLDEPLGIKRASDDIQLYRHIQRNFVKDYENITETIKALIDAGKIEHAHRKAHTLKSTARTIGAEKVADAALEIELSLLNKDTDRLTEQIIALENALRQLFEILAPAAESATEALAKKNGGGDVIDIIDVNEAIALMDELSPLLEAGYTDSLNFIDKIRTVFSSMRAERDNLITLMEDYEFDHALEVVRSIRESLV